jgi:murein DD-endopeptidase MepM/ murein hydrolase activator NlpD
MLLRIVLLLCLGIGLQGMTWAQEEPVKQNKLIVKPPVDENKNSSAVQKDATTAEDSGVRKDTFFVPSRALSVVSEDTNSLKYEEPALVQVSEFLKIDCVWVKAAEYYSIWSSEYINPYKIHPSTFKDTIPIHLYDSTLQRYWFPPLDSYWKTSSFGYRWGGFHHGIDLALHIGDPIYATFDGIVRMARYDRGYGYHVVLRHYNGLETVYAHMSKILCKVGQEVKAGEVIGLGGSTGRSTGPHLHFEFRYAGNPFNPEEIFDFYTEPIQSIKGEWFYLLPQHFRHLGVTVKQQVWHVVRAGDTLSHIARRYGVSVSYLMKINGLGPRSVIRPGQRLRIR